MSDVLKRLSECNSGVGVRNPDDYSFFMSVTEANEVNNKLEELQAKLDASNSHIEYLKGWIHEALQTNSDDFTPVGEVLAKTPSQSQYNAKADAVRDLISEKAVSASIDGVSQWIIYKDDAEQYVNELETNG